MGVALIGVIYILSYVFVQHKYTMFSPALFPFQHKQRMGEHRALKLLKRRVRGDAIEAPEGIAALNFFLQNEGRLACGQFSCVDRFRTTPAREDSLSRGPQMAHPIHYSIRGAYIALPIPDR